MKKVMLPLLIVGCLLMLSACSPRVVKEYVEKPVLAPDSLLVDPCEAIGAGDSVRSLAAGYISNTSCIGEYKLLLDKQRKHKSEMERVYNVHPTTTK